MDTLISAVIGAAVFLAFVIGLAVSIGSVPFSIIVALVSALMLIDFFHSGRDALIKRNNANSTNH